MAGQYVELEGLIKKTTSTLKEDKDEEGNVVSYHVETQLTLACEVDPSDAETLRFLQSLGEVKVVIGRKQLELGLSTTKKEPVGKHAVQ